MGVHADFVRQGFVWRWFAQQDLCEAIRGIDGGLRGRVDRVCRSEVAEFGQLGWANYQVADSQVFFCRGLSLAPAIFLVVGSDLNCR